MPLIPRGLGMLEPARSSTTVISFITNTNIQHYRAMSPVSILHQGDLLLRAMFFLSAAVDYARLPR